MKVSIIVPTYNGGELWKNSAEAISKCAIKNEMVLVIDSTSKDDTADVARKYGFHVDVIPSSQFNHGGTRNSGVRRSNSDIVIFLTQDAIAEENCIKKILEPFSDPKVACVYGRQLPHFDANPLAVHARNFSYKEQSYIGSLETKNELGLKTIFMSNSFSAYRVSVYEDLGGFPENTILCEDMYLAAKAVLANYKIIYAADAEVKHSHNYSVVEEFKRYFDIGVFHRNEPWIRDSFGGAGGEGKKFIQSEFKFLLKEYPLWIPAACIHNFVKIVGYKLGQNYKKISMKWIKKFSMHKGYWNDKTSK